MDIYEAKQKLLCGTKLEDMELRVTFYARVSSDKDEQLNSLENQKTYFTDEIRKNMSWTFVDGYIDEGISGISTEKRAAFNKMIGDAKKGKFDLILTKEISRFARNTVDTLNYTQKLLESGVGVIFTTNGLNTVSSNDALTLGILAMIAQEELNKLSTRIKFGHAQAIKKGVVLGNNNIYGYQKKDGKLIVDEEQAEMVKKLFEYYATGKYSMKELEQKFWDMGYRNSRGNMLMHNTMSSIISNPKYKGWYAGGKVIVENMRTKKQRFIDKSEWVTFKDDTGEIVPAIVSEELWQKANDVLKVRSDSVKGRQGICNHPNLLTGKMYCACCGSAYYRRESTDKKGNKNSKWVCSGKIKSGASSCPSFAIYESDIVPIINDVFMGDTESYEKIIDEYIRLYESTDDIAEIDKRIESLNNRIIACKNKERRLFDDNLNELISDNEYYELRDRIKEEINNLRKEISDLEKQKTGNKEFRKHLDDIRKVLIESSNKIQKEALDNDFIQKYIERIDVTPIDDKVAKIDITPKESPKVAMILKRLKSLDNKGVSDSESELEVRAGHTSKKMIEKYENDIKGTK